MNKKEIRDGKGSTKKAPSTRSEMSGNEKKQLTKALSGCNGNSTVKSLTARLKKSPVWFNSQPKNDKQIQLVSSSGYRGDHTVMSVLSLAHS